MLLTLFNIFLSIIELFQLIIQLNKELFIIFKRLLIKPERKNVKDETVVITGASKGLGRAMAIKFCQLGARVIILDIDDVNGDDLTNALNKKGFNAMFIKCDVSNYDQVKDAFNQFLDKYGCTILINNAGICNNYALTEINHKSIEKTIKTNLLAHFWTVKIVLPKMLEQKKGHIVGIASNFGLLGRTQFTDYTATKFGIVGFLEALEDELREFRKDFIKFTTVCPAAVETGLTKTVPNRFPRLFPIMTPDYAASKIVDSILRNDDFVIIPLGYSILYTVLLRLPRKIRHLLIQYLGSTAQPNHHLSNSEDE